MSRSSDEQTIRVSLGWIIVIIAAMAGLGIIGGAVGSQLLSRPLPPLISDQGNLTTTVQEVTISPSRATADIVERSERSIVILRNAASEAFATGFVVTNDGLIVTTADSIPSQVTALDSDGRQLAVNSIGRDELYGLTYFRATNNVVVPLDVRQGSSRIGETFIAISRDQDSHTPRAHNYQLTAQQLPAASPAGVQQLLQGTPIQSPYSNGAPLIDEEGRVAGLLVNPADGLALPTTELHASFRRVADNQRERNPFTDLGMTVAYAFTTSNNATAFTAEVTTITAGSPAARAGLRRGDQLTAINDAPLQWHTSVAAALTTNVPLTLTVNRNGQPQTLTLSSSPTPSATPQ